MTDPDLFGVTAVEPELRVSIELPRDRRETVKVPCAGGCGKLTDCEPYHDPDQVYCFACGVRAGRDEARRRFRAE